MSKGAGGGQTIRLLVGDNRDTLRSLPSRSVQCVVTSPPYFNLRDYGTAEWQGGDPDCDHWDSKGGTGDQLRKQLTNWGAVDFQARDTCKKCGALRVDSQIGMERTPEEYVKHLVKVFREVRRVLRDDGVVWLNLGDSYAGSGKGGNPSHGSKQDTNEGSQSVKGRYTEPSVGANYWRGRDSGAGGGLGDRYTSKQNKVQEHNRGANIPGERNPRYDGIKSKDLIGIPWLVAFALREDGWYLRQGIVWCLSGGVWVYARTQKGDGVMMVRDLARLDPDTVQLWNGKKWTRLLGMSRSASTGDEIEIVLRSGERISCTANHRFPIQDGLREAGKLQVGDVLQSCRLPEPEQPRDCVLDDDAAWLAGSFLADGCWRGNDKIVIASHIGKQDRHERLLTIAAKFGGSGTVRVTSVNGCEVNLYGGVLAAIVRELISGQGSYHKHLSPVCWRYSNKFLAALIDGYLRGDGHWDDKNQRWRLGFSRNYSLERDLRVACARLDYQLTLKPSIAKYQDGERPAFRGELRTRKAEQHVNSRERTEVVEIRRARCREVYDLGVADEPHLFALASGVLTHNSKMYPMPESISDRCTASHEFIFLLAKSGKPTIWRAVDTGEWSEKPDHRQRMAKSKRGVDDVPRWEGFSYYFDQESIRESVKESAPRKRKYKPGEFADKVFEPVGAGSAPAAGPQRKQTGTKVQNAYEYDEAKGGNRRSVWKSEDNDGQSWFDTVWEMGVKALNMKSAAGAEHADHYAVWPEQLARRMILAGSPSGSVILDPFAGSGTTGLAAFNLGRSAILCELSRKYADAAFARLQNALPLQREAITMEDEE